MTKAEQVNQMVYPWVNSVIDRFYKEIKKGKDKLFSRIVALDQDPKDPFLFLITWKGANKNHKQTLMRLDPKKNTFYYENGNPHTIKKMETFLRSMFKHCDL
ncbi:MAG: hypothetical protein HYZ47_05330 [Simkania negevensis]|nr:hypothetical protein [Simkania negevensis]